MNSIICGSSTIHFNLSAYHSVNSYLENNKFSIIFIIVDNNTHEHCLPYFLSQITTSLEIEIIEIEAGEEFKNIETCMGIWNALSELGADRKSLIINLGGGVITDLGGFIACTFKRGLKYLNIPTTLLSMVDASVGGKTGVDLGNLKNQIGVISSSDIVVIDSTFLNSLHDNELKSGMAEMLKHGLIYDENYWNLFKDVKNLKTSHLDELIYRSVEIKKEIVSIDPFEHGLRKTLNFGHTLGHAIESYFLSHAEYPSLLHGEAVAAGMIMECYLSFELLGFPKSDLEVIKNTISSIFKKITISQNDYEDIMELMKFDKKNEYGNINFVLLERIGYPKIDCLVTNEAIIRAFNYYNL